MYVIESRRTVGNYKTVAITFSKENALNIFEEAKKNNNFGKGYNEKLELTSSEKKKNPNIIAYAKVGGTHSNYSVRIRSIENV